MLHRQNQSSIETSMPNSKGNLHWDSQYASAVSAGLETQRSASPQDTFTPQHGNQAVGCPLPIGIAKDNE